MEWGGFVLLHYASTARVPIGHPLGIMVGRVVEGLLVSTLDDIVVLRIRVDAIVTCRIGDAKYPRLVPTLGCALPSRAAHYNK